MDPFDGQNDDDGDGWLVSYADMMTLIACFFILMTAFANFDPVGFQRKTEIVAKSFRKDKWKSSEIKSIFIEEEIANHPDLKKKLKVSVKNGKMYIVFSSTTLFKNGQSRLDPSVLTTLDSLIDILKTKNPNFRVIIEGHADDNLTSHKYLDSNWDISSLRATAILKRFEFFGFPKNNLIAIAKGNTVPLKVSVDKDGRMIEEFARFNRRAVIKVLEPVNKKKVKLGLGVYFNDATDDIKEGFKEVNEAREAFEKN